MTTPAPAAGFRYGIRRQGDHETVFLDVGKHTRRGAFTCR
jgi:hypothetical protein